MSAEEIATLKVYRILPHYQYKLRVVRGTKVPIKKRLFWVRGPQEALDYVSALLGMRAVTADEFRKAGGVFIKKMRVGNGGRIEPGQVVYPF